MQADTEQNVQCAAIWDVILTKEVVKMAYIEMVDSCKTYHMGSSTIYANRDVFFL